MVTAPFGFAVVCFSVALAGCATATAPARETSPVRPAAYATATPGSGILVVRRDQGNLMWHCDVAVSLDGKPVGNLRANDELRFYLPVSEEFIISAMGCERPPVEEIAVTSSAEKPKAYRVGFNQDGIFIRQTAY